MSHFDVLAATIGVPLAKDALRELRAAGFIVVRKGAIGEAQREVKGDAEEAWAEADKWRDLAFKRGELLDEIGAEACAPAAARIAARIVASNNGCGF